MAEYLTYTLLQMMVLNARELCNYVALKSGSGTDNLTIFCKFVAVVQLMKYRQAKNTFIV